MRVGGKVAIYAILSKSNNNGKPFYVAKVCEMVNNNRRATANKWECSMQQVLISTDIELEEAKFDLDIDKQNKYALKNISNPEKSIIRIEDFTVETHTVWSNGRQKYDEYKKPATKLIYTIDKCCYDKDYKTENRQINDLKQEIKRLKAVIEKKNILNSELRYKMMLQDKQVKYRDKLVEKEKNKAERAEKRLQTAKELAKTPKIITKTKIVNKIIEKPNEKPIIQFEEI